MSSASIFRVGSNFSGNEGGGRSTQQAPHELEGKSYICTHSCCVYTLSTYFVTHKSKHTYTFQQRNDDPRRNVEQSGFKANGYTRLTTHCHEQKYTLEILKIALGSHMLLYVEMDYNRTIVFTTGKRF